MKSDALILGIVGIGALLLISRSQTAAQAAAAAQNPNAFNPNTAVSSGTGLLQTLFGGGGNRGGQNANNFGPGGSPMSNLGTSLNQGFGTPGGGTPGTQGTTGVAGLLAGGGF